MKATVIRLYSHYACQCSRQHCTNSKKCRPFHEKLVDLLLAGAITAAVILIVLLLLV